MKTIVSIAAVAVLLAGCSGSAEEPQASETAAATPSSAAPAPAPSTTPTPTPSSTPTPTATPTAEAAAGELTDSEAVCDALGDLLVDMPILSAAPLDVSMGQDYRRDVAAMRKRVKELMPKVEWLLSSTNADIPMAAIFLPNTLNIQYEYMGIYGRDIKRASADGFLDRLERLELQVSGENIDDGWLNLYRDICPRQ